MYVPPLKTIRASLERARTKVVKIPSPLSLNLEFYWTSFVRSSYSLARLPFLIPYPPTTHLFVFLLLNPLLRHRCAYVQAASAGTAKEASPNTPPTSTSSNPLVALPTDRIMGPLVAHGLRTISSPLKATGALGRGKEVGGFPGISR